MTAPTTEGMIRRPTLEERFQALQPAGRFKKVVGSIRQIGNGWEYRTPTKDGFANTEADALDAIEKATLQSRADDASWAARCAEIQSLPEPLRTLRIELEAAAINLECERRRTVARPDDIKLAEQRLHLATMNHDAAERHMAEAA